MDEFDDSFESETVDTSNDSSFESSDTGDFDNSSSDSFVEDTSDVEYAEQQTEANAEYEEQQAEAEANAEYAEQQAEANAESAEQQAEAEANAEYAEDQVDESELSPAELYELGQQEAQEAQDEAEKWADENNMDTWSDGTPRENYEEPSDNISDSSSPEANSQVEYEAEQQAEVDRQAEYETEQQAEADRLAEYEAEQRAALEADVQAQADSLNKEYMDLMDRKQAAFDSTVDATNVEDRERFADLQRDLGEQMENVRSRIIENNNRLK